MICSKWDQDSATQIRDHPSIVGRIVQGKAYNRRTALTTLMPTRVFAKKSHCVRLPAVQAVSHIKPLRPQLLESTAAKGH
jgi:hypothetical protein